MWKGLHKVTNSVEVLLLLPCCFGFMGHRSYCFSLIQPYHSHQHCFQLQLQPFLQIDKVSSYLVSIEECLAPGLHCWSYYWICLYGLFVKYCKWRLKLHLNEVLCGYTLLVFSKKSPNAALSLVVDCTVCENNMQNQCWRYLPTLGQYYTISTILPSVTSLIIWMKRMKRFLCLSLTRNRCMSQVLQELLPKTVEKLVMMFSTHQVSWEEATTNKCEYF